MNLKGLQMIIENQEFRNLKNRHAKEILTLLLKLQKPFSILCVAEEITFNPKLPKHISSAFKDIIIFALANYTLQSALIEGENLIFEAGFGEENIGSVVTVPIENIINITERAEDDTPLFLNVAATLPKPKKPQNPFALNPRNQKFIRPENSK